MLIKAHTKLDNGYDSTLKLNRREMVVKIRKTTTPNGVNKTDWLRGNIDHH